MPLVIPLPFLIEKKVCPAKLITDGEQEGRKENVPNFDDSESEEDEYEGGHN